MSHHACNASRTFSNYLLTFLVPSNSIEFQAASVVVLAAASNNSRARETFRVRFKSASPWKQIPDKGATRQYWIYLVGELCTEEIQTPIQSLHDLAGLIGRSVYQSLWQCFCLSLQWSIVLLALWMLAVSAMRLNPDLWLVKCSNEHSTTFNLMDQLKKDQFIQNCGSCMFLYVPVVPDARSLPQPKDAASTTSASL